MHGDEDEVMEVREQLADIQSLLLDVESAVVDLSDAWRSVSSWLSDEEQAQDWKNRLQKLRDDADQLRMEIQIRFEETITACRKR